MLVPFLSSILEAPSNRRARTTLNKALLGRQPNVVSVSFIIRVILSFLRGNPSAVQVFELKVKICSI